MRDPNRIDGYCAKLASIWKRVPDWRFGQFVFNLLNAWSIKTGYDAFYTEDEEFFEGLERLMDEDVTDPYATPEIPY